MKIIIGILVLLVLAGSVIAADLIIFSGSVSAGDTIEGSVTSCGNDVCQEEFDEDYINCPVDCIRESYFEEPVLVYSKVDGISNNNYDDGWLFRFELDFYNPSPVYFGFKMDDFTDGSGHTIPIDGNVRIKYTNMFGVDKILNIGNEYSYTDEILLGTVDIEIKLPVDTYPASYTSNYYWEFNDEN